MSNLCKFSICCYILVLFQVRWGQCGEKEDEQSANSVFIRYDGVTVERWNKDPKDTGIDNTESVKMTIAELTQDYCDSNAEKCSLSGSSMFTMSDVVLSSDSPLYFNGDIKLTFYVNIEDKSPSGDNMYALPKDALTAICEDGAESGALSNATNGKWTVDFVGDKRVSAPIDDTLDKIIIPLSIILVILLAVFAVAMNHYHQKQEKQNLPTGDQGGDVVMTAVKQKDEGGTDTNNQNPTA